MQPAETLNEIDTAAERKRLGYKPISRKALLDEIDRLRARDDERVRNWATTVARLKEEITALSDRLAVRGELALELEQRLARMRDDNVKLCGIDLAKIFYPWINDCGDAIVAALRGENRA